VELADAHVHLFDRGFIGRYGSACSARNDLELYRALRREHAIGAALVVGYEGRPEYAGNSRFIGALAQDDDWIVPLAFVLPSFPTLPRAEFAGLSLYVLDVGEADELNRWPRSTVAALDEAQAIISVNASGAALARLRGALARFEHCRILISHLGDPGAYANPPSQAEARRALQPLLGLAELPQVGVKLSGMYGISSPPHDYPHSSARPFVELLVETFGPHRLFWGSDFSPALDFVSFAQTIDAVANLPWTDAEREAVMGGNLRRLLRRVDPQG
jgi:L-fuconolactonase